MLPIVGPGADPGIQAVSPQVTFCYPPAVGCHYFPPGLQSPSQPKNVTSTLQRTGPILHFHILATHDM